MVINAKKDILFYGNLKGGRDLFLGLGMKISRYLLLLHNMVRRPSFSILRKNPIYTRFFNREFVSVLFLLCEQVLRNGAPLPIALKGEAVNNAESDGTIT